MNSYAKEKISNGEHSMQIRFIFDNRTVTATLQDSASSSNFVGQRPLTVDLEDYAGKNSLLT
jgi:hypothetical protein